MRFFATFLLSAAFPIFLQAEEPTLQSKIEAKKAANRANADPEKLKAYAEGIQSVSDSGIVEKAKNTGDSAPDFTLKNATGQTVTLSEELKKGPVVLTWYRGGWCPYCNIQLSAYQRILPQIEELGAQLIALTPEVPDKSLSTSEKNGLKFQVLTDLNSEVAREYGLVFELTDEVAGYYSDFFSMADYNGEEANQKELPLAATYVIDQKGKITWAFLDADYTKRAEPRDIVKALDSIE
ncbi:MAG: peroxiredoxin [Verrucomicrobiales bacterium]|nr:peroxiredoxin [Verrucomicrobiales bacterium]